MSAQEIVWSRLGDGFFEARHRSRRWVLQLVRRRLGVRSGWYLYADEVTADGGDFMAPRIEDARYRAAVTIALADGDRLRSCLAALATEWERQVIYHSGDIRRGVEDADRLNGRCDIYERAARQLRVLLQPAPPGGELAATDTEESA